MSGAFFVVLVLLLFFSFFFSQILAKLYDDIVQRKQSALDASEMNDKNFRQALELILEVCFLFFSKVTMIGSDDDDDDLFFSSQLLTTPCYSHLGGPRYASSDHSPRHPPREGSCLPCWTLMSRFESDTPPPTARRLSSGFFLLARPPRASARALSGTDRK